MLRDFEQACDGKFHDTWLQYTSVRLDRTAGLLDRLDVCWKLSGITSDRLRKCWGWNFSKRSQLLYLCKGVITFVYWCHALLMLRLYQVIVLSNGVYYAVVSASSGLLPPAGDVMQTNVLRTYTTASTVRPIVRNLTCSFLKVCWYLISIQWSSVEMMH